MAKAVACRVAFFTLRSGQRLKSRITSVFRWIDFIARFSNAWSQIPAVKSQDSNA
jgi:hypothetical protein